MAYVDWPIKCLLMGPLSAYCVTIEGSAYCLLKAIGDLEGHIDPHIGTCWGRTHCAPIVCLLLMYCVQYSKKLACHLTQYCQGDL